MKHGDDMDYYHTKEYEYVRVQMMPCKIESGKDLKRKRHLHSSEPSGRLQRKAYCSINIQKA